MLKQEFEKLIGMDVTTDVWEVVKTVYMYHPCIGDVKGKELIVQLWNIGGIGIMRDLLNISKSVRELKQDIEEANRKQYELATKLANIDQEYAKGEFIQKGTYDRQDKQGR